MYFLERKVLCAKKEASKPVGYEEATRTDYHERNVVSLGADSCAG